MAQISTPFFSPKMYRHFAVITLSATTILALFAEGESRQAMAAQVEERGRAPKVEAKTTRNELLGAEYAQEFSNDLVDNNDDGFTGQFGAPMDRPASRPNSSSTSFTAAAPRPQYAPAAYSPLGISPDQLAELSEEERQAIMERLRQPPGPQGSAEERQRQIDALNRASEARAAR